MKVQVYRANSSSYQDSSFFQQEKAQLESLAGVSYAQNLAQADPDLPFILLSNTHTVAEELPDLLLQRTKLMIHPNSGWDNISANFVKKAPFPIVVGNPIRAHAVAEYILACVFQRFALIQDAAYWPRERLWPRRLLRDQSVLILGMGHIGSLVYRSLLPLCSNVEVVDPHIEAPFGEIMNVKRSLEASDISQATIVIVCASLGSSSKNMINREFLSKLPPNATIVNPARGEIVNEEDLIAWLKKNPKGFAFVDVFQQEPFPPGFMADVSNAIKTPHIAGVHA